MTFPLRLVAGSTVAPKESPIPQLEAALKNVDAMTPQEQVSLARRLVLNYEIDGQRIEDFIAEAGARRVRKDEALNIRFAEFHAKGRILGRYGICMLPGGPFPEMTVPAFGTVIEVDKLLRKFKKLRPLAAVLPGLALY